MSAREIATEAGSSPDKVRSRLKAGLRGAALFAPSPMHIEVRLELVEKIEMLGKRLGLTRTEVVERAVAELARRSRR